ncbi:hypothetical protein HN747_02315 [archaeon]|nr:hypothetical protein [archaeon]
MEQTILIGGAAGQGINAISTIITRLLTSHGYYVFNYRDYPSLIRGGHNFNVVSVSRSPINSTLSKIDVIIALDKNTIKLHKKELNRKSFILTYENYPSAGRNLNLLLAAEYLAKSGFPKAKLKQYLKNEFKVDLSDELDKIYNKYHTKSELKKLDNKLSLMNGSLAIATGAIKSKLDLYVAYPMTPSTGVLHELGLAQNKNLMVFQGESEIGCASMALGLSFAGKVVMTGTSGGGFDLMGESLSMQGQSEIPLCVYLSSRPGPATGVPTYTAQADLDIALRSGHGEFARVVAAPGDAEESIRLTNEILHYTYKYNTLGIILGDKHLAESEFSFKGHTKFLPVKFSRDIPGKSIAKASSYEQNKSGNTTEDARVVKKNFIARSKKYNSIKKDLEKNIDMIKIHGKKDSKNLILAWGSTKGVITDVIKGLDVKFLQVLYVKPLSKKIKQELVKAKKVILIENNQTGQLGRLIREKTGISIPEKNRILKYDGRPFWRDELKLELKKRGIK